MSLKQVIIPAAAALLLSVAAMAAPTSLIWTIGIEDGSSAEFALDASRLNDFKKNDFFFEDHFFVIGHSDAKLDFPFLQAGITDAFVGGCPVFRNGTPILAVSRDEPQQFGNLRLFLGMKEH